MRHQSERGFVLLILMVLMQIILLLATHAASTLKVSQLNNRLSRQYAENRLRALLVLNELPKQSITLCSGQRYSPHYLTTRPEIWWRERACAGNDGKNEYYYIQESLKEGVCNKENRPVRYLRNTLLYSAMVWQETIAVLAESGDCMETNEIKLGRLMVRQLR